MPATLRTAGTWTDATTGPVAPTIGTHAVGDYLLGCWVAKPTTTGANPFGSAGTGWNTLGTFSSNNVTAQGADVGDVWVRVVAKEAQITSETASFAGSSAGVMSACVHVIARDATEQFTVQAQGARDTTSGTGFQVGNSFDLTVDDLLVLTAGLPGDNVTFGTWAVTATGITFSAVTKTPTTDAANAGGNDLAASGAVATVTAGTNAAITTNFTTTLSGSQDGSSMIVRVRTEDRKPQWFITGSWLEGTTTVTPVNPAHASGNRLIAIVGAKPTSTGTPPVFACATAGWSAVPGGEGSNTSAQAQGTDLGQTWIASYYNDADSAAETNPTITVTNGNVCLGVVTALSKDPAETWVAPVGAVGGDTASGTTESIASSAMSIGAGDLIVVGEVAEGNATHTAQAIAATGMTFGTYSERAEGTSTLGNDLSTAVYDAAITAGTEASVAITHTATLSTALTSTGVFIRNRTGNTNATATPAVTATVVAFPAPTVTAGADATPAVIVTTAALPAASTGASLDATATPAVFPIVAALPAASPTASSDVSPAVIATTVALPAAVGAVPADVTPAVIATTVAFPAAVGSSTGTANPAVIATTVGMPTMAVSLSETPDIATIALTVALPPPTASFIVIGGSQATETDTANHGGNPGTQVEETDTAQAGVVTQALLVVGFQAEETSTANAGTAPTTLTVSGSQGLETSEGQVGALIASPAGTQAEETDTGHFGMGSNIVPGGQASETDTANAGASITNVIIVGTQAAETDTANDGEPSINLPPYDGFKATELDDANLGSLLIRIPGTQAVDDAEAANAGSVLVAQLGTQAEELDEGLPGQAFGSVIAILGEMALEGDSGLVGSPIVPPSTTYLFSPPTIDVLSPIGWWPSGKPHEANNQFQHYKSRAVGQSVLKLDGVYTVMSYPSGEQLEASTESYIGGHVYEVSAETAQALSAAGLPIIGIGGTAWDGFPSDVLFPADDLYPTGG